MARTMNDLRGRLLRPMVEAYRKWAVGLMTASDFAEIADRAIIAYDGVLECGRTASNTTIHTIIDANLDEMLWEHGCSYDTKLEREEQSDIIARLRAEIHNAVRAHHAAPRDRQPVFGEDWED